MASGSASYSGRNVTVTVSYPAQLANYGNSGRNAVNRSIEISGDGQGYVTIGSGYAGPMGGVNSASYTWTYAYGSNHTWDSRGYYTDINTGANGAYRDSCSGSISMPAAPAPPDPGTANITGSASAGYASFTCSDLGASGYLFSGQFSQSGTSTSVGGAATSGTTVTEYVQAYNDGDGVNTSGRTYGPQSGNSVYVPYPAPSAPATPNCYGSPSGNNAVFSWDNVGASGYSVYINGSFYTNTTATGITIGSTPGGNTSCYVQAYNTNPDNVSASSGTSNTVTVHIPNPPAAPGTPTLSGSVSGTSVNLSWNNVSASGYYIYRNGAYLTSTSATSYTDSGLARGSTYNYYVVAQNTNSDGTAVSGNSNTYSGYILNPPAAPGGSTLSASAHANGDGTVDVSWTAVSATGYKLVKDGSVVYTGTATSYSDTGNARGSSHTYYVFAYNTNADGTTNGPNSNTVSVTIPNLPAAPGAVTISGSADANTGVVNLSWTNVSASGYDLYKDSALFRSGLTATTFADTTNSAPSTHTYYVKPYNTNAVGRTDGANSNTISIDVPVPPPPPAPSVPTVSTSASNSQAGPAYNGNIVVSWTAVNPTGYRLYRDSTLYQTLSGTTTSFTDSGLPYDATHSYYVVAFNTNAGGTTNAAPSNISTATVPRPNPPNAPAVPPTPVLTATARYQQVTLSWTGAASYFYVFRDGVQIATQAGNMFIETRPPETYSTYYVTPVNSATNPGGTTTTTGTNSNNATVLTKAIPPSSVGVLMG